MVKTFFKAAGYMAAIILTVWTAISFFDIISNNLTTCKYWEYNFFILLAALKK